MIAIPDLINAASKSTAGCLDLLTHAGKGGTNHTGSGFLTEVAREHLK